MQEHSNSLPRYERMSTLMAIYQTRWPLHSTTSPVNELTAQKWSESDSEATRSRYSAITCQWLKHFWLNSVNHCRTSVTSLTQSRILQLPASNAPVPEVDLRSM